MDENLRKEQNELDLLIGRGVDFKVPSRSVLRYLGTKERVFKIRQPFLGTLDRLSAQFIKLDLDEKALQEDPIAESKRLQARNAKRCARIAAIAILNNRLGILFLSRLLGWYLLWRMTPRKLYELAYVINLMSNMADFTNSIRLMFPARTTAPSRIETPEA